MFGNKIFHKTFSIFNHFSNKIFFFEFDLTWLTERVFFPFFFFAIQSYTTTFLCGDDGCLSKLINLFFREFFGFGFALNHCKHNAVLQTKKLTTTDDDDDDM